MIDLSKGVLLWEGGFKAEIPRNVFFSVQAAEDNVDQNASALMAGMILQRELEKRHPRTVFTIESWPNDPSVTARWSATDNHPNVEAIAKDFDRLLLDVIQRRNTWLVRKGSNTARALAKKYEDQTAEAVQERELATQETRKNDE